MLEEKSVFPESDAVEEPLAYVNGGDGSMVLDHEVVFVSIRCLQGLSSLAHVSGIAEW